MARFQSLESIGPVGMNTFNKIPYENKHSPTFP